MPFCVRWIPWLVALLGFLLPGRGSAAHGQGAEAPANASYAAGTTTNLFAAPGMDGPVDGWFVRLPGDWTLERAVVLRYGSKRVPVEVRRAREATDAYVVMAPRAQRGPVEVILRVDIGPATGSATWSIVPFEYDAAGYRLLQGNHRIARRIEVKGAPARASASAGQNRALSLRQAAEPLLLRRNALPALSGEAGFAVEFWMKTTGLEEVVLSTWTGQEEAAYPMEMIVDVSGRLRYYCGQQGQHESVTTRRPVADGQWHHVALVYEAARQHLVLLHEGRPVDSLRAGALPSFSGTRLAVGGRVPDGASTQQGATRPLAYSGQLDGLRFWNRARSTDAVRTMARRVLTAEQSEGLVALNFDGALPGRLVAFRPRGAERVASELAFTMPLRDLHATVEEDGTIRLAWAADDASVEAFVVERSSGGQSFRTAGRVRPRPAATDTDGSAVRYEFSDPEGGDQIVYYRIRQQLSDGTERLSGTLKLGLGAPDRSDAALIGNFPNPFNETTTIAYEVRERQPVTLTVWNVAGHQVATLVDDTHTPGYYERAFQADNLPSGTYFVRLETPDALASHKMVLLK